MEKINGKKHAISSNVIRYIHFRRAEVAIGSADLSVRCCATGGLTVAYTKIAGELRIGIARCRINEHYEKATGRAIATKLLVEDPWLVTTTNIGISEYELIEELCMSAGELKRNLRTEIRS